MMSLGVFFFYLIPLLPLESQDALSELGELFPFTAQQVVGLQSNGRTLLFYPQGYLNFSEDLSVDHHTLLSIFYSQNLNWPSCQQAQWSAQELLLLDDQYNLWSLKDGSLTTLNQSFEGSERIELLEGRRILQFKDQQWQVYLYDQQWNLRQSIDESPLSILIQGQDGIGFFSPEGSTINFQQNVIVLEPSPTPPVLAGLEFQGVFYLWSPGRRMAYSTAGELLNRVSSSFQGGDLLTASQREDRLRLYWLDRSHREIHIAGVDFHWEPMAWNDQSYRELLLNEGNNFLEALPQIHRTSGVLWLIELSREIYLQNPLDREIRAMLQEWQDRRDQPSL